MNSVVRISFYGSLAEVIGREVEFEAGEGVTIGGVRRHFSTVHPQAATMLAGPGVRACLGDQLVGDDTPIGQAAEVAFLPPLSGG